MKKIAVLTQPLFNNYGGLLQAYALQKCIKDMGHDVITIDFNIHSMPRFGGVKYILFNLVKKYILRIKIHKVTPPDDFDRARIGKETRRFTSQNIKTSQKLNSKNELSYLDSYNFDTFVVGSDQVWRRIYSPDIGTFYLDFLNDGQKYRRISYAASFGTDDCSEYTEGEISKFSKLLKKFDFVGVRESSGVELCREYFGVDAAHVLDPTMLIEQQDYINLINNDKLPKVQGNMMVYVLDKSDKKKKIIDSVANFKKLKPFSVMQEGIDMPFPKVTEWLRGFVASDYVVTDSFHGVAFSILFNKQFIAIGNPGRGLARFKSILEQFGLTGRLIYDSDVISESLINTDIDYGKVNQKLKQYKEHSLALLKENV